MTASSGHVLKEITSRPTVDSKLDAALQAESEAEYLWLMTRMPELFAATYFDYELAPFQIELLNHARNNRRSLILVPKGHGKSSLVAKVLPILEICSNPNVRIILIMKTAEDASAYAGIVRTELIDNQRLIEDFGPFHDPRAWAAQSFNVSGRQIKDPHYTLEIYGVGGKYLGHRSELTICDDIVTEENSWTREQREKLKQRFETAIQTGPQSMWGLNNPHCKWEESSASLKVPKGVYWPTDINYDRIVVCGTRFHPQDLYNKLEHDPTYANLYFDCWTDKEETSPLWPSMWTKDKLESEKKSLGTLSFNKRYRNIALDESELGFKYEWIYGGSREGEDFPGCLDRNREFGEYPEGLNVVTGFDPASGSTSRYATFPSFVCIGFDPDKPLETRERYVIDIFRSQTGFDELIDVLLDGRPAKGIPGWRAKYNHSTVVIEKNGYGTMFIDNDRMRRAQAQGLRVVPHWTQSSKMDPIDGAFTMQGIVKQGLLRIPYGPRSQKKADEFIDQFLTFPKGIVDWCMSTWFVEIQVRKQATKGIVHLNTPGRRWGTDYWVRPSA
uniref:Putative terminase n=1 Tax=viral metagenome TaxID=1070528 RepID=A0A6M3KCE4_9ZZZZ